MGREWTIKSFKSGNSVALRVPASAGIVAGEEWQLIEAGKEYVVRRLGATSPKIDLTGIWGTMPDLTPRTSEERQFDNGRRVWDDPDWSGWPEQRSDR